MLFHMTAAKSKSPPSLFEMIIRPREVKGEGKDGGCVEEGDGQWCGKHAGDQCDQWLKWD